MPNMLIENYEILSEASSLASATKGRKQIHLKRPVF